MSRHTTRSDVALMRREASMNRLIVGRVLGLMGVSLLFLAPLSTAGNAATGHQNSHHSESAAQGSKPPADWTGRVTEEIRRSEYRFSPQEDGSWAAPNRAHDLRSRLDESGVRVTSRTKGARPQDGGWELQINLSAEGREGGLSPVPQASAE